MPADFARKMAPVISDAASNETDTTPVVGRQSMRNEKSVIFDQGALRALIAEVVRDVVGAALRGGTGGGEYLTVAEAARMASVTPGTIRDWIRDRRLPRLAAGRQLRVRRADLEEMLGGGGKLPINPEDAADRYLRRRRRA